MSKIYELKATANVFKYLVDDVNIDIVDPDDQNVVAKFRIYYKDMGTDDEASLLQVETLKFDYDSVRRCDDLSMIVLILSFLRETRGDNESMFNLFNSEVKKTNRRRLNPLKILTHSDLHSRR